ncbi:hypothetical protein C1878_10660 [Gordonibacter sp. 28C]|nr:hypothetical protein C1878_10660 [Gordonibacter sp. 28C]
MSWCIMVAGGFGSGYPHLAFSLFYLQILERTILLCTADVRGGRPAQNAVQTGIKISYIALMYSYGGIPTSVLIIYLGN